MATTYKMNINNKQLLITTKLMKKTMLFAAIAALVLVAGCAKNIDLAPTATTQHAIGFSNYAPRSLTKVNDTFVSGTSLVENKTFAVYAWATAYNNFLGTDPGAPAFMNPAVVTWKNDTTDGDGNTYEPVRYWPAGDQPDNLSFAAYYPYGGAGITAPDFTSGVGTYVFAAQNTSAAMVDFLVADVVNDQTYNNTIVSPTYPGTVKFNFKHQLTKVQFQFKKATGLSNTTVIELAEAKLVNIKTNGTLSATYAQNATPAVNAQGTTTTTWSARSKADTPFDYDVTLNQANPSTSAPIVLTTTASTVHQDDIFLMVPQKMVAAGDNDEDSGSACVAADEQKLVITWNVKVYDSEAHATANGSEGLISTTTNTANLSFKNSLRTSDDSAAATAINWAKNQQVNYTITIGPKPILFTAEVAAWTTPASEGFFNVQ